MIKSDTLKVTRSEQRRTHHAVGPHRPLSDPTSRISTTCAWFEPWCAHHIQQASRRKDVLWIGEGERMICNPSDLHSNSLKGVPTAQNCLLKSMGVFGCDLSEKTLKNLAKASDFQAEYEGSIPFTRSKSDFNDLLQSLRLPFQRHSDTFRTSTAEAKKNLASVFNLDFRLFYVRFLSLTSLARWSAWWPHLRLSFWAGREPRTEEWRR
jgi:hypothetical protein